MAALSDMSTMPAAAIPTAHPANPPAFDAVTERHGMGKPQKLSLHQGGKGASG